MAYEYTSIAVDMSLVNNTTESGTLVVYWYGPLVLANGDTIAANPKGKTFALTSGVATITLPATDSATVGTDLPFKIAYRGVADPTERVLGLIYVRTSTTTVTLAALLAAATTQVTADHRNPIEGITGFYRAVNASALQALTGILNGERCFVDDAGIYRAQVPPVTPAVGNVSLTSSDILTRWVLEEDGATYRPFINAKAYGCQGDGTTDDTTAAQAAATAAENGTLYFPPGTYMIAAGSASDSAGGIMVPSNCRIILAPGATLKTIATSLTHGALLHLYDVSNVRIEGGTLDGNRSGHVGSTGEWGHGLSIQGCTDILVVGVKAKNCWGDGFYVGKGASDSANVTLRDCLADNNRRQGLSIVSCVVGLVAGGVFKGTNGTAPQAGIDVEADAGATVSGIRITGATMSGNTGSGLAIYESGVQVEGCLSKSNTMSGFYITDTVTDVRLTNCAAVGNTQKGIWLNDVSRCAAVNCVATGNTQYGILLSTALGCSVVGCSVSGNTSGGIALDASSGNSLVACYGTGAGPITLASSSHENSITACSILSGTAKGISLSGSNRNTLTGNRVTSAGEDGIYLSTSSNNTIIGNTMASNVAHGIRVASGSANMVNGNTVVLNGAAGISVANGVRNAVVGNTCEGNSQGGTGTYPNIELTTSATYGSVQGNMCRQGSQTAKPNYGVRLEASANNNLVQGNDLYDAGASGAISDSGTATAFGSGNYYGNSMTATLVWDPGNLVDGAGETSSAVAITGAAFGDAVDVIAPYDLQGIAATAWVSSSGNVKARLQNETGGAIDLVSGTWTFRVRKA